MANDVDVRTVDGERTFATREISGKHHPVPAIGLTYTDYSVSSATGSSQSLLAANANAKKRIIVNDGATPWAINPTGGTASVGGTGCLTLNGGDYWETDIQNAMTGIGSTGAKLTVLEA